MNRKKDNKKSAPQKGSEWAIVQLAKTVFNLELKTAPGRVNAAFGFLAVILAIALTVSDWAIKIILSIIGLIKTAILKQNIVEPYETTNAFILIILTLSFFVICIFILHIWDSNKKKIEAKVETKIEEIKNSPLDDIDSIK